MIELDIPPQIIRKIKALNLLVGGGPDHMGPLVNSLLDRAVSLEIIERLDLGDDLTPAPAPVQPKAPPPHYEASDQDASGISSGLGDEASPEDEAREEAWMKATAEVSHASAHKVTASEIYADTTVKDPTHEAISDAPRQKPGVRAEAAFASATGIPVPADEPAEEVPPRARSRKRQRPLPPKAKVTLFETEANSF